MSSYFEMCGLAPSRVLASLNYSAGGWESATVRMLPTGKVEVVTGATPHGQGHETCWSMIVAERLGVSPDDVEVLHSDTAISPLGMDTYGSRSLPVGGVAIAMACDRVIDKAKQIAAHQLEAAADDLEFSGGVFQREGLARQGDAAGGGGLRGLHRPRPARRHRAQPRGPGHLRPAQLLVARSAPTCAWSRSTRRPGQIDVLDYVAVDDCGTQINPMIVEGQVHGGIVQGLAQALFEEAVFDADGNPQAASLAEYLVPAAVRRPDAAAGPLGHAVAHQPARGEGRRRGRHHRRRRRPSSTPWSTPSRTSGSPRCGCRPRRSTSGRPSRPPGGGGRSVTADATDTAGADRDAQSDTLSPQTQPGGGS